nr:iron ABC transporter permease [Lolliginicoccus suaedae]
MTARVDTRRDHSRLEIPRGTAPLALRLAAVLLDAAVTLVPIVIGFLIVHSLRDENGGGEADRLVFGSFALAVAVSMFVWNLGFRQGRDGASAGKRWCGLIVRGSDGGPLGVRRSLLLVTPRQVVRRVTALDEGFEPITATPSVRAIRMRRLGGLIVLAILLAVVLLASIAVGARPLTLAEIWAAVTPPYDVAVTDTEIIVRSLRLPRAVLGLIVGAALGMAGALIQGHTRNPLADPGILGVSAGAALAVVLAIFLLGIATPQGYIWFALIGAFLASALVFGLSAIGSGKVSPLSLVLGGTAIAAFLSSLTSAMVLLDQQTLDSYRFWVVGSVAGRGLDVLVPLLPFFAVGFLIALASSPGLNLLSLGEEVARSLGIHVGVNRVVGIVAITLLTGAATAACGPIGFLGMVVPHLARAFTGPDYRWIVPFSALIGAIVLVTADVVGRVVVRPGELQVGIVLALVGAPFFIAVVRRRKLVTL